MADKKTTFFFGAGAEVCFGMPLGAQYTLDTILSKRSKMYDELKDFYKDKLYKECIPYYGQFLFKQDSHTFKEIIMRAGLELKLETNIDNKSQAIKELAVYMDTHKDSKKSEEYKNKKTDFDDEVENVLYNYVILDIDKPSAEQRTQNLDDKNAKEDYLSLMQKFSYYGTVEKDFSTIIDPKGAGHHRFWRLINYFWSAFFSIIFPVLKLSSKYCDYTEENKNCKKYYKNILNNLNEVIGYIYSDNFKKEITKRYCDSYYCKLSKAFPNSNAVTTNYTPFLGFYYQNPIYLAGKLSQFEIPNELRVVDLSSGDTYADIADKMIFPFMLTQAPIKPIIDVLQLSEYSSFLNVLNSTKTLVIVGYGINANDNHINALIRDFLVKNNDGRLVFVKYKGNRKVAEQLKISDPAMEQKITVIPCDGTPEDIENLIAKLKEITL